MKAEDIDNMQAELEQECAICHCAFSAQFEGIICPDCIDKAEGAGK